MTRLEKQIKESLALYNIDHPEQVVRISSIIAMGYIKKAFEAGVQKGFNPIDAPDIEQWLNEQKLQ